MRDLRFCSIAFAIGAIGLFSAFFLRDLFIPVCADAPSPVVTITQTVQAKPKIKKVPGPTRTVRVDRYPPCPPGVPESMGASPEDSARLEAAGGCVWSP